MRTPETPQTKLSKKDKVYYKKVLDSYRTGEFFEEIQRLVDFFGIDAPRNFEIQVSDSIESSIVWVKRILSIEKRYKNQLGEDMLHAPNQAIETLQINPGDEEILKAAFYQIYARFLLEKELADRPDATAELLSKFRGGDDFFENFVRKLVRRHYAEHADKKEQIEDLGDLVDDLEALEMLADLKATIRRTVTLLLSIWKSREAKNFN